MTETYMTDYLEHKVETTAKRTKAIQAACVVAAAVGLVGGMTVTAVLYALIPWSVVLLCVVGKHGSSYRWGMVGEERLRTRLRQILPEGSAVFHNVPVGDGDIDCVAVTRCGVWAFESKYLSGEVSCVNGHWCRLRNRDGEVYPESLRSPSAQLARGIGDLKSYLAAQGVQTWIRGAVVFTHPRVDLRVAGLNNMSAVTLSGLTALPPGPELPEGTRNAIIEALMELRAKTTVRRSA